MTSMTETKGELYPILLAGLIADEQLDDAGLDAFLSEARKLADKWLGRRYVTGLWAGRGGVLRSR